jgi:hypothetical protein
METPELQPIGPKASNKKFIIIFFSILFCRGPRGTTGLIGSSKKKKH